MCNIIIKSENFAEVKSQVQRVKAQAIENRGQYACGFAVFGAECIARFVEAYRVKNGMMPSLKKIKTDGKTSAEFIPCMTVSYYCELRYNGEVTEYFTDARYCYVVSFEGLYMCYYRVGNKDMYRFYIFNDDIYSYRNYLPYGWGEEHPEPNNVGTLTDKKLRAWADYLRNSQQARDDSMRKLIAKETAFMERINALKNSCDKASIEKTGGCLVKNGLRLSWSISNHNVHTELEVCAWLDDMDDVQRFELMSKGAYKGK